jgi:Predicted ATPase of the PP-loop superfamily implicated in cell cycle control
MGKNLQYIEGLLRRACVHYEMIQAGDRICVGVSGGKDSVVLAVALKRLQRYYGLPYEVIALSLDPGFKAEPLDFTPVQKIMQENGIPYKIYTTDIGKVVFDIRKETTPCSLCAKMRRGILHDAAKELGCNKVALGHHLDDAIETFYMNLWGEGRIACFSPVSYLSRKDLTMIRPMVYATEQEVIATAQELGYTPVASGCPIDGTTKREEMKQYVTKHSEQDPAFRQKMLGALQKSHIDRW